MSTPDFTMKISKLSSQFSKNERQNSQIGKNDDSLFQVISSPNLSNQKYERNAVASMFSTTDCSNTSNISYGPPTFEESFNEMLKLSFNTLNQDKLEFSKRFKKSPPPVPKAPELPRECKEYYGYQRRENSKYIINNDRILKEFPPPIPPPRVSSPTPVPIYPCFYDWQNYLWKERQAKEFNRKRNRYNIDNNAIMKVCPIKPRPHIPDPVKKRQSPEVCTFIPSKTKLIQQNLEKNRITKEQMRKYNPCPYKSYKPPTEIKGKFTNPYGDRTILKSDSPVTITPFHKMTKRHFEKLHSDNIRVPRYSDPEDLLSWESNQNFVQRFRENPQETIPSERMRNWYQKNMIAYYDGKKKANEIDLWECDT